MGRSQGFWWVALSWVGLMMVGMPASAALAQPDPTESRPPAKYEAVVPGLLGARKLVTDALDPATLQAVDLLLGPGQSATAVPVPGPTIVELRSGLVETTIDGQIIVRRPGDYWVVLPGQAYGLRSLGSLATLRALVFGRK
jgi:hypothetical protein